MWRAGVPGRGCCLHCPHLREDLVLVAELDALFGGFDSGNQASGHGPVDNKWPRTNSAMASTTGERPMEERIKDDAAAV